MSIPLSALSAKMGGRRYEFIKKEADGTYRLPPETVELGNALKKRFGFTDADLRPVHVYPDEYLDDEEGEKAK
jgi:hypothetical protein